jgi:hypothetical protein
MSMVHPDKFPSGSSQWQEANRMALEVNDAYQKIKTSEARRAFQSSQNPPHGHSLTPLPRHVEIRKTMQSGSLPLKDTGL